MAEKNGEALMREMNTYLNQAESAQNDADTALPFESISDYLGDPTGFSDVTAKLWKKVSAVFDLAGTYNRHSSEYLKSLVQLEKGIKFLGSSCLQKHALEMKKYEFPELKQLNTTNLYTMAALHFNKLDRALTEYMDEHQNVDDGLLDMEYRFYNLMERIRATEVKIYNYRDNYYLGNGNSNPIIHGLAFSDKSWTKSQHEHDEPMAFQRAKAFQFKSEIRNQKSEIASGQCSVVSGQVSGAGCQVSGVSEQDAAADSQQPVDSGQLPVAGGNEEGRMKKVESVDSDQCSVVSDEAVSNEDERMKNDEFSPDRSSENKELSSGRPSENEGMVREQLSKKKSENGDQCSVVSDQCSVDSDATSHSSFLTPHCSEAAHSSLLTPSEIPQCVQIMQQVVMRSRIRGLDYLGFTEREMRLLAADPLFDVIDPAMAADLRKALAEHDSG